MHRILLVNKTKNPSRDEMSTTERTVGELFFASFDLQWAGYNIVESHMKKAAGWIVPVPQVSAMQQYLKEYSLEGYDLILYEPCTNHLGGYGHRVMN